MNQQPTLTQQPQSPEQQIPMIWTSKGNRPIAGLTLQPEWTVNDDYIKFVERWRDESGEVVKESAHVYDRKGVHLDGAVAAIG